MHQLLDTSEESSCLSRNLSFRLEQFEILLLYLLPTLFDAIELDISLDDLLLEDDELRAF